MLISVTLIKINHLKTDPRVLILVLINYFVNELKRVQDLSDWGLFENIACM